MQLDQIQFFSKYIEKELGIIYSEANHYQLQNRLEEIAGLLSLKGVDELYLKAREQMTESMRQLLLDIATNNETSFFRDGKVFKSLQDKIFPELLNPKTGEKLRVWSAACSYGQEPYGLTMIMQEYLRTNALRTPVELIATDIAVRVLDRAKEGRYTQLEVQRGMPPELLNKYFQVDDKNQWFLRSEIRNLVSFQKLNLLDSFVHLGQFKMILCRNVLIYQNIESKKKIIRRLADRLEDGGYLLLGAGESLIGLSDDFDMVRADDCVLYRKKLAQRTAA